MLTAALMSAQPARALAAEFKTVRYSKNDLKNQDPNSFLKAYDLSDVLSTKIKTLAVTITKRQSGSNVSTYNVAASAREDSKEKSMRRLGALSFDPTSRGPRGNTDNLRIALSQQARKAAEVKFKEAFPVFGQIKNGLVFKLDILKPENVISPSRDVPVIRYGLVETDILPAEKNVPMASLGGISESDTDFLQPAKVVYTIDRIDGGENRKIFMETTTSDDLTVQNASQWGRRPSMKVDVKINAADQDAAVTDQVGQGAIPAARITLTQADGFISTQFIAGSKSANKSMTTEFKAPLYGEMSLAQKYNYKMQATQTAALNVLGEWWLPRVNLLYANVEKKIRGEWVVKRERFEYNVTAESRPGFGENGEKKFGKVGDKLSFGLATAF